MTNPTNAVRIGASRATLDANLNPLKPDPMPERQSNSLPMEKSPGTHQINIGGVGVSVPENPRH